MDRHHVILYFVIAALVGSLGASLWKAKTEHDRVMMVLIH